MLEFTRNCWRKPRLEQDRESPCPRPTRSGRGSAFLYRQAQLALPSAEIGHQLPVSPPTSQQERLPTPGEELGPPLTKKQKQELLKSNFEKMKRDGDELAELAKSLQEDLDKSNRNVLSLKVVERAEKIEKLARKIKTAAKGQ